MAQGTFHKKRKRQGNGHGIRNHRHASGNGLVRWYYGGYQAFLKRPKNKPTEKMYSSVAEAFNAGRAKR